MVTFKDLERSFEAKFARDEELRFRAHARANRLIGEWAAQQLGLIGQQAEAYSRDLVMVGFNQPGTDAVFERIRSDFDTSGVSQLDHQIRRKMDEFYASTTARLKAEG